MIVTEQWIDDNRTPAGGWTAEQLRLIDVDWPPRTGWKNRAEGLRLSVAKQMRFEEIGRLGKKKAKPLIQESAVRFAKAVREKGYAQAEDEFADLESVLLMTGRL